MTLAQTLMDVARLVERQGTRVNHVYMNSVDHAELLDTFEYSEAEDAIYKCGGTYHDITTKLGQMRVARRLAARRHQRFHALRWLVS